MFKLKKDDQIKVLRGKDRGREGKIEKIFPSQLKILVPGLNIAKKHLKAKEGKPGGIIEIAKPILASKVALICPKCHQPTRVGFRLGKTKQEKSRTCLKCKQNI